MATEEQKKANLLRLNQLALLGLSAGIWDMLGDGSLSLSAEIGHQLVPIMEKEMGLEIAGEDPEEVLQEVGRLFVDEFGYAGNVYVERDGDTLTMKVEKCINRRFSDRLLDAGAEKPFICPFMCVGEVVLDRMGSKALTNVEKWVEGDGSIITFEIV